MKCCVKCKDFNERFLQGWDSGTKKNGSSQYKSFILRRFLIKSHFHLLVFLSISLKKLFGGHGLIHVIDIVFPQISTCLENFMAVFL